MPLNTSKIIELVDDWEEVYNRGQATLWILLALLDGEKYAQEITLFITRATNGHLAIREQSLYRALRRFNSLGMLSYQKRPSPDAGPDRKYYRLTPDGEAVLKEFVTRHIAPLTSSTTLTLLKKL